MQPEAPGVKPGGMRLRKAGHHRAVRRHIDDRPAIRILPPCTGLAALFQYRHTLRDAVFEREPVQMTGVAGLSVLYESRMPQRQEARIRRSRRNAIEHCRGENRPLLWPD